MVDPLEAAAKGMYDIWCDTVLRHFVGDSADSPIVRDGWKCMEDMAKAAIDAYHAAAPSDYAELVFELRHPRWRTEAGAHCVPFTEGKQAADAIENLEAERDALKARVALLEETLSAIVDEVMDGDFVSAEQIARAAGRAALEKDDD